ncbi:small ribosomal subunit Rsm22 family protein [Paucidesulfovibrio longus]|uniref:small ribosomal subunit Rsm22 family protein n=1 Tax=Paucidesulfovibrio longus TaxID=889 RepID=UPI0003B5303B|nr:small ribosomal subunit Rsm22 family protein [Paucidesulfovibrio longus]
MSAKRLSTLFPKPNETVTAHLAVFGRALDKIHPLKGRHLETLPYGIRDLSRMLTDERGEINNDYMGNPGSRTAYLRYFLPWNLYRLVRLFQGLDRDGLGIAPAEGATVADLGSGPLTVPLALWIALPELRTRRLRLVCVDRTPGIMRDGLALLREMAGEELPWKIDLVKGPMHTEIHGRADLLVAANALNELHWGPGGSLPTQAERVTSILRKNMADDGKLLIIEPGTRRSGTILSHLRRECLDQGFAPLSPCPHAEECPMPGTGSKPWCHFRLPVTGVPRWLQALSNRAGLPKNDTSISFLFMSRAAAPQSDRVRAVSNIFPIPDGAGQYGCCERGLVLIQAPNLSRGGWPGDLLVPQWPEHVDNDPKSGALILPLDPERKPRPAPRAAEPDESGGKSARTPRSGTGKGGIGERYERAPKPASPRRKPREGKEERSAPAGKRRQEAPDKRKPSSDKRRKPKKP